MNEKEIAELRRRFRPEKTSITHIRGCCVNENREIVSQFDQSLALLSQEESEKFLSLLRKTLSGGIGKNLVDITFTTQQVADSPEHRLLMALRSSALKDEQAVQTFFQQVIGSLSLEGNYLILLARDAYDVPYRSRDGERQDDASAQKETFQSLLGDTLGADCSLEVVQAVQEQLCQLIQEHKECRQAEPLTLSKGAVTCVLRSCGVSDRHAESFDGKYDEAFGPDAALSPGNLVDTRQLELRTPDVTIRVSAERGDLVDTRVIDGVKYILIRADEGVQVNGVNVQIS